MSVLQALAGRFNAAVKLALQRNSMTLDRPILWTALRLTAIFKAVKGAPWFGSGRPALQARAARYYEISW